MDEFRRTPVNRVAQPQGPRPQPQAVSPSQTQPQAPVQPILRPGHARATPSPQPPQPVAGFEPQPPDSAANTLPKPPKKRKKKVIIWSIVGLFIAFAVAIAGAFVWFNAQLAPVDSSVTDKKVVTIQSGTTPDGIAKLLKDEGLIRNQDVFLLQARIDGVQNKLQAGAYRLSPSESTPEIIEHLSNGKVDTFTITFLPGKTVADNKKVFKQAGYGDDEINEAFAAQYTSPLFEDKPASADLEGYIFADTFSFGTDTTVKQVLEFTFDHYYKQIQSNNLIEGFKAQGLTLFQGINMASIIEKEAVGGDEKQIAQVFLLRYKKREMLGSDPTYQYITDKLGVPRDLNYDSPYNTRRYTGLPPTPIAVPSLKALEAVANPAEGDFMYFLSGDDDITYFSKTFAEHEANIAKHCKIKCLAL